MNIATTGRLCALLLVLGASSAWADYTLTCGSEGGRHRSCALREPGEVRLIRQISGAKCEQGRSWDFDGREIWVDHGCEAEFGVDVRRGGYGRPRDEPRYAEPRYAEPRYADPRDAGPRYAGPNGYGPRPGPPPYVADWLIGTFEGFDRRYRASVTITVRPDGRTTSELNGRAFEGYIEEERLHVGEFAFDLDQTREGFTTSQRGDRENVVRYRRID